MVWIKIHKPTEPPVDMLKNSELICMPREVDKDNLLGA